jgi:hypothetical protein
MATALEYAKKWYNLILYLCKLRDTGWFVVETVQALGISDFVDLGHRSELQRTRIIYNPGNGQSPQTQWSWVLYTIIRTISILPVQTCF